MPLHGISCFHLRQKEVTSRKQSMQLFAVLISAGLWYSPFFVHYLLPIEHKRYGSPAILSSTCLHSNLTQHCHEQNLHLCCFLQSTVNIPSTLSQVENNNIANTKLLHHLGDVFKFLSTWTERRLQNLQLHHEMVLSPLSKTHMEYTSQESLLELDTGIPSISTHRHDSLYTALLDTAFPEKYCCAAEKRKREREKEKGSAFLNVFMLLHLLCCILLCLK